MGHFMMDTIINIGYFTSPALGYIEIDIGDWNEVIKYWEAGQLCSSRI